jgi:hypothetical protein
MRKQRRHRKREAGTVGWRAAQQHKAQLAKRGRVARDGARHAARQLRGALFGGRAHVLQEDERLQENVAAQGGVAEL